MHAAPSRLDFQISAPITVVVLEKMINWSMKAERHPEPGDGTARHRGILAGDDDLHSDKHALTAARRTFWNNVHLMREAGTVCCVTP